MAYKRFIVLLIVLSIAVKVIFLFATGSHIKPQTFEYEEVAKNLLEGKGFYYVNFRSKYYAGIAPGYPIFCYIIYKVFGHNPLLILLTQILFSSLIIIPLWVIARSLFGEKVAILSSFLVALHPPSIVYASTKLHSMSLYAFFITVFVLALLQLRRSATLWQVIFVGIMAGLTVYFRATIIVFLPLGMVWFYLTSSEKRREKIKTVALVFLIFFLLMLPWGIRNFLIFHKPILLQTNRWESLWYGNIPGSKGGLYLENGITSLEKASKSFPPEFYNMNEIERGKYFKERTLHYFKSDPIAFIKRIVNKAYYFWYFSPYQGSLYPKSWMRAYKLYYFLIIIPALIAFFYCLRGSSAFLRSDIMLIGLLFFALTALHSLYFVEGRHRWSIEPFILIFTAQGIMVLKEFFRKRFSFAV